MRAHRAVRELLVARHQRQVDGGRLVLELERREVPSPVGALVVQRARERQQPRVACPVVKPDDRQQLVGPAIDGPLMQRPLASLVQVIGEVLRQRGDDARIAGGVGVLRQHLQHHHRRPPVGVRRRPERAGRRLVRQRPLDVLVCLGNEGVILQQVSERQQSVEIVRAPLPAFARAAEPSAVRADIRPDLVEMSRQAAGLNLQLTPEPALRPDGAKRQQRERARLKWRAVPDDASRRRRHRRRMRRTTVVRGLRRPDEWHRDERDKTKASKH